MTGSSDKSDDKRPDAPAEDGRASEGLDNLLNNPAATIAAATAFGISMATQMSRFWLGSLQGAMEMTGQLARQLEDERKAEEAARTVEPAAEARPAQAPAAEPKPARVTTKAKPAAEKPKRSAGAAAKAVPVAGVATDDKDVAPARAAASKTRKAGGQADDLKRIDGIGPKLEQVLKGRGFARFSDLAVLDDEALAALDKELGLDGRSLRDDWKGQAGRLLKGAAKPRKPRSGK